MSFPRKNYLPLRADKIPPSNPGYPFNLTHSSVAAGAASSSPTRLTTRYPPNL
uniref:Uncharacterized protein n=1 Tax=Arundo donax TaxID=35708 RepID=A0A0A9HA77_ARUDO